MFKINNASVRATSVLLPWSRFESSSGVSIAELEQFNGGSIW